MFANDEKFICPRSVAEWRPFEAIWNKDKTCSYDGSLHPDIFMNYVRSGKLVGTTDKGYKFYMDEYEGKVRGAKKFYTHHLSDDQAWEFYQLWITGQVNFGLYPPYVRLYLPGVLERLYPTAHEEES